MLYEYAVEPSAIAANWDTCRYLAEKFGFDRGRLLSLYPTAWLSVAVNAAAHLPDMEKKRVTEKLIALTRHSAARTKRGYSNGLPSWLANAIAQQAIEPFHAIIATADPTGHGSVVEIKDVEDTHPLIAVTTDFEVLREAPVLAEAMALVLKTAKSVMFVDAYYDPYNARYQNTLRECLKLVHSTNPSASCEIHHLDHTRCFSVTSIEKDAKAKFGNVIPAGMTVTLYRWRKKSGGADFHARYLLTDKGGIRVDAGFSAEGAPQKTDMSIMNLTMVEARRLDLERDAAVYELVEPVLQIAPTGYVERI